LNKVKGAILGIAVGDALGIPVDFSNRSFLRQNPVVGMKAYGSHHQSAGTWSDDTALSLCLLLQLVEGYDLQALADKLVRWKTEAFWTPHGEIFDVGIATNSAIHRLQMGATPYKSGECEEYSNGNGALMRIFPLAFYLFDKSIHQRWDIVCEVSGITHCHIRSKIACFVLIELAVNILKGLDKCLAYQEARHTARDFANAIDLDPSEQEIFFRIFYDDITQIPEAEIYSTGYVIHTLEASLWSFLKTNSFSEAVLMAVNLGGDTDTTGSVTGALAGLYYGYDAIPQEWINVLARKDDILALVAQFNYLNQDL
jgi:ADP-ribosyl-[dinitrogen reductase] hydrolase